jgi:hypothetical protein
LPHGQGQPQPLPSPQPRPDPLPQAKPQPSGTFGGRKLGLSLAAIAFAICAIGAVTTGVVNVPGLSTTETAGPAAITTTAPVQSGGLITPVSANDTDKAIQMLAMSEPDRAKVQEAVKSGKARLGWITVSDSNVEDGDWVSITGAGFRQDVRLAKAPLLVVVPFAPGTPLTITGLVDPGGGITLAVHVGTGTVGLKPLKAGESIEVPTQ